MIGVSLLTFLLSSYLYNGTVCIHHTYLLNQFMTETKVEVSIINMLLFYGFQDANLVAFQSQV